MYDYETEKKEYLFTDRGQRDFLKVRDKAKELLATSGAIRAEALLINTGCTWNNMACIDRLVELGELVEVAKGAVWQHRVFVSGQ